MFIKNPESIKRKDILRADRNQTILLIKYGYSPISIEKGRWLFVMDENMKQILKFHHMTGGEKDERHK